ncbi:MAG: hypothetical protein FJ304_02365 [Planctomycetes bacterium]|nr:hypothetical protein [Planctomycetota bacterium]
MPITLGCPSCGKRFRARDESAGKKVKCPYCQAAVQVPTAEESGSAGAPTASLPSDSGTPAVPAPRAVPSTPSAPVVATPDDWGASPTAPAPAPPTFEPQAKAPVLPSEPASDLESFSAPVGGRGKDRPKPAKADKGEKGDKPKPKPKAGEPTAEEVAAAGWKSVRRGLFWVQIALLFVSLIAFIGFGKAVYARSAGPLPKGDGADWVKIEGYVNDGSPNAVPLRKEDLLDLACYGLPVLLACVPLTLGRLIAGGAPRNSGARGLFALSAMFTLVGLGALVASFGFERLLMKDEYKYTWGGFLLLVPLAEFWFLTGLTSCGMALKRPRAARAVGAVGFVFALTAFVATLGWSLYVDHLREKPLTDDWKLMEQGALMLGWLLLVGVYWRAVRNVRSAAKEYLDAVAD